MSDSFSDNNGWDQQNFLNSLVDATDFSDNFENLFEDDNSGGDPAPSYLPILDTDSITSTVPSSPNIPYQSNTSMPAPVPSSAYIPYQYNASMSAPVPSSTSLLDQYNVTMSAPVPSSAGLANQNNGSIPSSIFRTIFNNNTSSDDFELNATSFLDDNISMPAPVPPSDNIPFPKDFRLTSAYLPNQNNISMPAPIPSLSNPPIQDNVNLLQPTMKKPRNSEKNKVPKDEQNDIRRFIASFPRGPRQIIGGNEVTLLSLAKDDLFIISKVLINHYNILNPTQPLSLPRLAKRTPFFLHKWLYDHRGKITNILENFSMECITPKKVIKK